MVKQALQEFIFNMNVPTRVGFQTPFSNITLDLTPSPNFKDQAGMIGGKPQKEKYGEFQHEMDMLNKAFFEVMGEGDAAGRVFTFPIPTVNVTKDFDWDNPNLAGLWEITAKYGIPYFSNFVNSDMHPEDTRSMCCRLRLDLSALDRRGGGLFGANALTGSVGVVTINMPRLGYVAKHKAGGECKKGQGAFLRRRSPKKWTSRARVWRSSAKCWRNLPTPTSIRTPSFICAKLKSRPAHIGKIIFRPSVFFGLNEASAQLARR